jgi:hypothetical protein
MNTWGIALNWKITDATDRFRTDVDRWNLVDDLSIPFYQHAYCDSDSWFTSYERSWATQGNKYGTAHPNATGQMTYGNLLRRAIVPNQVNQPYRRLTITIQAVKAASAGSSPPLSIDAILWRYQNDPHGLTRWFTVPRNGQWTPIPPALGVFTLDVYPTPSSPRHATELSIILFHSLPIVHTLSDGYGIGTHTVTHPTGNLAVTYQVAAASPTPPSLVVG